MALAQVIRMGVQMAQITNGPNKGISWSSWAGPKFPSQAIVSHKSEPGWARDWPPRAVSSGCFPNCVGTPMSGEQIFYNSVPRTMNNIL